MGGWNNNPNCPAVHVCISRYIKPHWSSALPSSNIATDATNDSLQSETAEHELMFSATAKNEYDMLSLTTFCTQSITEWISINEHLITSIFILTKLNSVVVV